MAARLASETVCQNVLQKPPRFPTNLHAAAVANKQIVADVYQARVLPILDGIVKQLPSYDRAMHEHADILSANETARQTAIDRERRWQKSAGMMHRVFRMASGFSASMPAEALPNSYYNLPEPPPAPVPPQGAYLYGDVGCGKSMLMDILFKCADKLVKSSARVHYHAFMMSVYQMIHRYDKLSDEQRASMGFFHPLDAVVGRLGRANSSATGGGLLCFDEFQVADVADARLMHGIFDRLMRSGTVVCFTANRAPADVNRSQLQDADFIPFLDLIHDRCKLIHVESDVDYRSKMSQAEPDAPACYFRPDDVQGLHSAWKRVTGTHWDDVEPRTLAVAYGRRLDVDRARGDGSAVQMSTAQLIEAAVGASDYRALAKFTRTIFVTDVMPVFTNDIRNLARRFITLIDVCYEEKVRIIMRMEAEALELMFSAVDVSKFAMEMAEGLQFETEVAKLGVGAENRRLSSTTLFTGEDEQFAFRRAVSRLREMQTSGFGKRGLPW